MTYIIGHVHPFLVECPFVTGIPQPGFVLSTFAIKGWCINHLGTLTPLATVYVHYMCLRTWMILIYVYFQLKLA